MNRVIPHPWGEGELMAGVYAAVAEGNEPDPDSFEDIPDCAFAGIALAQSSADATGYFATAEVQELLERCSHLLTPPSRLVRQTMRSDAAVPSPSDLRATMDAIFEGHDVLCSPTMALVAPIAPPDWASPYCDDFSGTNLTFIVNATGCPAVSVPCGLSEGLPVGFQIIGRLGDEVSVLRAARAVELGVGRLPRPYYADI